MYPLKIRHHHTARIGQDIRNQKYILIAQDRVGFRRRRTVRALGKNAALQTTRVDFGDLHLERRGNQHVTLKLQQPIIADPVTVRATFETVIFIGDFQEFFYRQSLHVDETPGSIRNTDDFYADIGKLLNRHRTDVAKSLDHRRAFGEINSQMFRRFNNRINHAAAGRFAPAQ